MKSLLTGCLLAAGLFVGGQALADTTQAPAAATQKFEASEKLEALRYRHLWIAYGIIWLSVFGFMLRTWKRSEETAKDLEHLKTRLSELEGGDG